MDVQTVCGGDDLAEVLIVGSILQGIDAVGEDVGMILACGQEAEVEG